MTRQADAPREGPRRNRGREEPTRQDVGRPKYEKPKVEKLDESTHGDFWCD